MRRIIVPTLAIWMALAAVTAEANCPSVPENPVWGNVGNAAIVKYVDTAYRGDWAAYIEKWQGRLDSVRDVMARHSVLVFHDAGIWLRGAELEKYVNDVRARLVATRCLAEARQATDAPGETVAGTVPAEGS